MMKYIFTKRSIAGSIAVLLLSICMVSNAQESIQVNGVVLTFNNQPLANASVSIEGSTDMPVLTDDQGQFSIRVPSPKSWLMISATGGFKNKRINVNGRYNIRVVLTPLDVASGDDPVAVLSHLMPSNSVVASHVDVDIEDLEHTPSMSFDQFMQGKVPGLHVVNRSGAPGSGAVMSIRGVNSLNGNNEPLVVVDGIPKVTQGLFQSNLAGYAYNPLMAINTFDISRLEVFKDPTITAAYGSKASNGLIFIETLDPSATQTSIEIDYRNGYSLRPEKEIPVLNANQHRTLVSEILFSSRLLEEDIVEQYPNLFLEESDENYINYQHNTNWQNLIFDNALFTNFNLNVKGGDEIARYGLSFGYTNSEGVIKNTGYQSYNLRFVSMLNIFTWLKMDADVSLNYSFSDLKEAASVKQTSPIMTSITKSPMLYPYQYDLEEKELDILSEVDELGVSNPMGTIDNFSASNSNYNFTSTLGLIGLISDHFTAKSIFSLNYNVLKEAIFMPNKGMELYYNKEAINVAKLSNNNLNSFYNNTHLAYSQVFGDHRISSTTGANLQVNSYQFDWGLTKNAHENDEYRMIQDGDPKLREIGGQNSDWNWLSFYEYVNYSYKNKYMVSASASLDGSSRVGDNAVNTINLGVPFGLFYGGGVSWRLSSESFLKNAQWIDDLKLRFSYGTSGNDDLGEASATNFYRPIKFRETVGLYPGTVLNEELTYETVTQMNAGLDFATAGYRFSLSVDLYKNVTDSMLILAPIDAYLGYSLRLENNGSMENKGIELGLYYRIIETGSFNWDVSAALATNMNQITTIQGDELSYEILGGERINKVGEPANSFYGYRFLGVYSKQADADTAGLVNDKGVPYQAGDAIFEDISGPNGVPDSVINFHDKTTIGSSLPLFHGGFSTTFSYKRLSLDIAVQFSYGNDIFNYVRYMSERMSTLDNQSTTVLNRWQFEGHDTDIPRAQFDDLQGNSSFSSRWIEDGSYARLKHVALSYKIPDEFLVFRNAEFYVSANNLLTLSNYLGYYPEFAYSYSPRHQGVDYGLMPQSMQFMAGIKLGL
ncbi:MAG: SusC/RagA family TonB-linked outer membrane protein [Bacteroidales bacterium]|nr:SusC/RagA family TonB-linked outer membrane protein [Bacteroidales bacterium]